MKDYVAIFAGCIVTAAAINIFLVPFKIAPGGVTGVATVVYYLSSEQVPVGITMLILNIPLFLGGYRLMGRRFFIRTLYAAVLLSVIIDISEPFTSLLVETYVLKMGNSTPDLLLYSLFGGFIMGLGLGLVFRLGATTGGTDLAARILKNYIPSFSMGQVLLLIDAVVIIFAAIAFKSFQLAMYAIVTLFVSSKIIDTVIEGVNFAKAFFIISDKSDIISTRILTHLDRGVTSLKGTGMYTKNDRQILFCVVRKSELTPLKRLVKEIDPNAFLILTDVREVMGEGFKNYEQ